MPSADQPSPPNSLEQCLEFWRAFGFDAELGDSGIEAPLPANVIALEAVTEAGKIDLTKLLSEAGVRPDLVVRSDIGSIPFYRVCDEQAAIRFKRDVAATIRVSVSGDRVVLPTDISARTQDVRVENISAMSVLPLPDKPDLVPASKTNPLLQFSLRGKAAQYEEQAVDCVPLLGAVAMTGQATLWYAPPNAGKTLIALHLILEAIASDRIDPGNVFYVNADDNSKGLAAKLRLMDDAGAHTLVPGQNEFRASDLAQHLRRAAEGDEARGVLVVLDTAKKFTSLMDKKDSSAFADACRQFVMRGGAVLALAHTNKNPTNDGKLRYAGTTDLLEDFDAAYLLTPLETQAGPGEKVVQFTVIKRRADSPEKVAYAYAGEAAVSYDEKLSSVREVDPDWMEEFQRVAEEANDAAVITAIASAIQAGITKKMDLAREVALRTNVSKRTAVHTIEKYTGDDPAQHRWSFQVRDRGAKVFALLEVPTD